MEHSSGLHFDKLGSSKTFVGSKEARMAMMLCGKVDGQTNGETHTRDWKTKLDSLPVRKPPARAPKSVSGKINMFGPKKKFQNLVKEVIALEKMDTDGGKSPLLQEDKDAIVTLPAKIPVNASNDVSSFKDTKTVNVPLEALDAGENNLTSSKVESFRDTAEDKSSAVMSIVFEDVDSNKTSSVQENKTVDASSEATKILEITASKSPTDHDGERLVVKCHPEINESSPTINGKPLEVSISSEMNVTVTSSDADGDVCESSSLQKTEVKVVTSSQEDVRVDTSPSGSNDRSKNATAHSEKVDPEGTEASTVQVDKSFDVPVNSETVDKKESESPPIQEIKPVKISFAELVVQATGIDWAARKAARDARLKAQEEEEQLFKTFDDQSQTKDNEIVEKVSEIIEVEEHESSESESETSDESEDEDEKKEELEIDQLVDDAPVSNKEAIGLPLKGKPGEEKSAEGNWQKKLDSLTMKTPPPRVAKTMTDKLRLFGPKKKFQNMVKEVISLEKTESETDAPKSTQGDEPAKISLADVVVKATGIDWAARKAAREARLKAQEEDQQLFKTFDDVPSNKEETQEERLETEIKEEIVEPESSESSTESEDDEVDEEETVEEKEPKTDKPPTESVSHVMKLAKLEMSGKHRPSGKSDILKEAILAQKKKKGEDTSYLKNFLYGNIGGQERRIKPIEEAKSDEVIESVQKVVIEPSSLVVVESAAPSLAEIVAQATGIDWAARKAARTAHLQEEESIQTFRDVNSSGESEKEEEAEEEAEVFIPKVEEIKVKKFVPPKPEVFDTDGFLKTLRSVQAACPDIKSAMEDINQGVPIKADQLKRIANELRVEKDILVKSGKQVIPAPMRMYILNRCHEDNHVGSAKIYEVMKAHFYWPNMFNFVKNTVDKCNECVQRSGKTFIKDVAIPTYDPSIPMEFITLDIVHMPVDRRNNRHLLLIGDVFSKYVRIAPIKDRTMESVKTALMDNWFNHYTPPQFLFAETKNKVDVDLFNDLCTNLNMQKRCGGGYHGLKRGFAERHSITVKDMFTTLQEEYKLPKDLWSDCIHIITYIVNSLPCSAAKEVPYKIVAPYNIEISPMNKKVEQNEVNIIEKEENMPKDKEGSMRKDDQEKDTIQDITLETNVLKEDTTNVKQERICNGEAPKNPVAENSNSVETIENNVNMLIEEAATLESQDTTLNVERTLTEEQWLQVEAREGCFPTDSKSASILNKAEAGWISANSIEEYVSVLQWQIRELLTKVVNKSWKSLMREGHMKQHQQQQQQQQQQQISNKETATAKKEKPNNKRSTGKKKTAELHFDGTGDVKAFLEQAEEQSEGRSDAKKAMFICSKLGGKAFDFFRLIPTEERKNLEAVKSHLLKKFCREERNKEEAMNALNGCRLPGESNERFAYRLLKLVQLAHVQETPEIQVSIAKYYFKQGLKKVDGIVYDFDDIIENERKKSDTSTKDEEEDKQKLHSVSLENEEFLGQLQNEQKNCSMIQSAKDDVRKGVLVKAGHLKRIATELRIENDILTKSGKPIVPAPLREFILNECHKCNHVGSDKVYELVKSLFYWQNMYNYIKNVVDKCNECCQKKSKMSLIPSYQPSSPMEFITIDIVFMAKDRNKNRYLLLIADVYSKYVEIVPIRDKTFTSVRTALWTHWLNRHGYPQFLLVGPKCQLDGEILNELCLDFQLEKRMTTGYHSLRRGFGERDISTVKKMFVALTDVYKLAPEVWSDCVPCVMYTLNTAMSSATNDIPFIVVYERQPNFPSDTWVKSISTQITASSSAEYVKEVQFQIKEILLEVLDKSREDLMKDDVMKQHVRV